MSDARRPRGREAQRLLEAVLRKGGPRRICWLCGHPGADTMDHVIPVKQRPDLAWTWTNLKPAHGTKRTISRDGYECQGNYSRGNAPAPTEATRSREW